MTRLFASVGRALAHALESTLRHRSGMPAPRPSGPTARFRRPSAPTSPPLGTDYPGDFTGRPEISYAPHPGDLPDPGEVVWGWVPFEEDHADGKDRPVLVIGRDGDWLLALPLTSADHDRDAEQEAAEGRYWVDIGAGAWDRHQRPSEARVDRIVRLDPAAVRRIGGTLSRDVFAEVAASVRRHSR